MGVVAGLADGLAGLAEQLALGRALAAGQVLGHHDRRQDRADLDPLVQERGRVADGLFAAAGEDRVGQAQKQPAAVGVAGFQRPAQEQAAAARAAQEVGQIVAVEIALFGGQENRLGQDHLEHPADQGRADQGRDAAGAGDGGDGEGDRWRVAATRWPAEA